MRETLALERSLHQLLFSSEIRLSSSDVGRDPPISQRVQHGLFLKSPWDAVTEEHTILGGEWS